MDRKWLGACAAIWLATLPGAIGGGSSIAAQAQPPQTRDRLSQDRMRELVAGPISIVQSHGLEAGKAAFERLLARTRAARGARSVKVADLIEAFGVGLYSLSEGASDRLRDAAIPYLEAAIAAYREAFGPNHAEVAVALHSYADAQLQLHPDDPPESADAAYEEAYRIRLAALGPSNIETRAALQNLARLRSLPSRTQGDRGRIEATAALYRQLIANSPEEVQPDRLSASNGRTDLAHLYARYGMAAEAREQLRLAVRQARSWSAEDRCRLIAVEVESVEDLLTGEAFGMRDTGPSRAACLR
jgi:tetratricopeptide (TPR) repeat protein